MPGLQDLLAASQQQDAMASNQQPQQQDQQAMPQGAGQPQAGANPLAALAAAGQQQQQPQAPAPNRAQTMAAMHRFSTIKNSLSPLLKDPGLGVKNVRPKILDAASKLLGSKVLSLSELMNEIKNIPDDPQQQKKFVENMLKQVDQAQISVIEHHRNAPPEQEGATAWSPDTHDDHMSGLMQHYGVKNG